MAIEELISAPTLKLLLDTAQITLSQTLSIVALIEENNLVISAPTRELLLQLSQRQKTLHAYLAKLRGLHRRAAFGARSTKQETATSRQEVDRLLLQLQNLYYEQRHLMGEIDACEGYDHAYTHLPLIQLEEYLDQFPEQREMSEQEIMPLRIAHEKQERQKMEEQRLELVKVKETLLKENARKKEELKQVDEKLEAMIDGFTPLEEMLQKVV